MSEENQEPEYWTMNEDAEHLSCKDFDEAILEGLLTDPKHWDDTVTVHGFARRVVTPPWQQALTQSVAEHALEWLDDEFAGGDDPLNSIGDVRPFAEQFVAEVIARYKVWACEVVCSKTVDLAQWIRETSPHLMDEPEVKAWVEARLPKESTA